MSKVIDFYKNGLLVRYDKDPAIPYYKVEDFPGLNKEENSFKNSNGETIKYFFYSYNNFIKDKVIMFCPGIGPGHTAYLREIETLAKKGYRVLTLDYSGTGESEGERLVSFNAPTRDVDELLKQLNLQEEIMVIGHSLGGYTALNIINLYSSINTGVIISGFLSIYLEMKAIAKLPMFARKIAKYEAGILPNYSYINNERYLFKTNDKILFIHSKDDQMVTYKNSTKIVETLKNPNLSFIVLEGYKHNPNYDIESVRYMNQVFGEYNKLQKENKLPTLESKQDFFSNVDLVKLTNQNEEVWNKIFSHLNRR